MAEFPKFEGQRQFSAIVIDHCLKSTSKGSASVNFKINIIKDFATGELVNKTVFCDLWLTPNALPYTYRALHDALEWGGLQIQELNEPVLFGKTFIAVCEWEEYNDEERFKIRFFNRIKSMNRLAPEKIESLIAEVQPLLDAQIANTAAAETSPASMSQTSNTTPAVAPEDLPF